ncbi:MAG: PorV/PorQ family protein [Bacteroidetes bacterium]|nr:PorV/PorQ family protein [Bacteroidota bacterium]HET6243486.1 PorV/PorQ family protein [Bacteroidia bacterium]
MNRYLKFAFAVVGSAILCSNGIAGNKDRAGQAGGSALLINPWARSTGWGGANTASVSGIEAMSLNVAGIAFTKKTEIVFAHTNWLNISGSIDDNININAFGLSQRVGETGVIGLSVLSMNFGDVMVTTVDLPEGGLGNFSPSYSVIGLSYAKEFSNSIYGGLTLKMVSEKIANAGATGVAIDAGVRYVTGENDKIKFGIALRNVGPPMKFKGDGLSIRGVIPTTGASLTVEQRTSPYELPSMINIGASYDFKLLEDHRLTLAGNFASNSFTRDQILLGLEYGFKNYFMLRGGYAYEEGITSVSDRVTAFTGPSAGATFELPLNDKGTTFGFDYSYRATNPFNGVHSLGVRINL